MNSSDLLPKAELFLRLAAAVVVGGLLGLNRILHGKPTGFRTLSLVALGAAATTVALGIAPAGGAADLNVMSRGVQGILTGIGFLGAGVILRDAEGHVSGLTTAATVWVTAGLGILFGLGDWILAIGSSLLVWFILRFGGAIEHRVEGIWKTDATPRIDVVEK